MHAHFLEDKFLFLFLKSKLSMVNSESVMRSERITIFNSIAPRIILHTESWVPILTNNGPHYCGYPVLFSVKAATTFLLHTNTQGYASSILQEIIQIWLSPICTIAWHILCCFISSIPLSGVMWYWMDTKSKARDSQVYSSIIQVYFKYISDLPGIS